MLLENKAVEILTIRLELINTGSDRPQQTELTPDQTLQNTKQTGMSKQCRSRSDATQSGV